jgi:L-ascorbate metabolism protein UlaG (beta-lactamase superfamily)
MNIQLIRNATLWLEYGGETILVDPMFSEAGANPPIINTENDRRNPLVPLPVPLETLLNPSLVIVTHTHLDHWDVPAMEKLSKQIPLICQPNDHASMTGRGFQHVNPVDKELRHNNLTLYRTEGRHGTGDIGRAMGPVSGFALQAPGEPTLYLAGDTIYCEEVEAALDAYKPEITVVNAGGARFVTGDPITMTAADIAQVCGHSSHTQVIAVHLEAINHCLETRADLRSRLLKEDLMNRVSIPLDGEWL